MAEPRFQVFVSSTYTDLIQERQAAMSALLQLGAMPAGMELFPAADDEAWTLIERVIDESDYYLLIVGGRYGSVTREGVGFTEQEYDFAVSRGKPVMAFLHANPDSISLKKSDVAPDLREKLLEFTEKVKAAKHVKLWNSADDLAGKIALSYSSFIRTYPAIGWIRANAGDSAQTLKALAQAQQRVSELEAQVAEQASAPPSSATSLADSDESVFLTVDAQAELLNLVAAAPTDKVQAMRASVPVTWNSLLSELGPTMLNEASQRQLRERFGQMLRNNLEDEILKEISDWLNPQMDPEEMQGWQQGKRKPKVQLRLVSAIAHVTDFETVLLQLDALGLIKQIEKKRPVSDPDTYWTLTPWGRTRLTQLRAVRSGQTRPPSSDKKG